MKKSVRLKKKFLTWMKKPTIWILALVLVFGVFAAKALAEPPDPDEFRIDGELLQPGPTAYPVTNGLGETLVVTLEVKNDGSGQYVPPGSYPFSEAQFKGGSEGINTYTGTYDPSSGLFVYPNPMMCFPNKGGNIPDISHIDLRCTPKPSGTPTPNTPTPNTPTPNTPTPNTPTPNTPTPKPNKGLCIHIGYSITIDGVRYDNLFDYRKKIMVGDVIISADGKQEYVLVDKAIKVGDIINSIPDVNKLLGLPDGTLVLDQKSCQHFPLTVSADNEQNYIDLQFVNTTGAEFTTTPRPNIPEICVLYATLPYDENGKLQINDIEETYSSPGYRMKALAVFKGFTYPDNFSDMRVKVNSELNLVIVTKTK